MNSNLLFCKFRLLLPLFLAWVVYACDSDERGSDITEDQQIEDYLQSMDLLDSTQRDDSGIYYQIITENPAGATPAVGDMVEIFYTANAADQAAFDSVPNDGVNDPAKLQFGTNSVIPVGLDNCLSLLKVGEVGIFYLPPSLAYGELEDLSPLIPINSVIKIQIELASITTEAQVYQMQIDSIEQFILDHELNDSIWAHIDTVMTPIDSLWIPNMNLTTDSVMVPLDSIWYDVVGGAIPVDSVFHYIDSVKHLGSDIFFKTLELGQEGTRVESGDLATIRYQLYTLSSYPNNPIDGTAGAAFNFFAQTSEVITGLDAGVFVMEYDERALLILPSNQAYQGSVYVMPRNRMDYFVDIEMIPSYSLTVKPFEVLVFEVTLLPPQN